MQYNMVCVVSCYLPLTQKELVSLNIIILTVAVALSLLALCWDNKAFSATWLCDET